MLCQSPVAHSIADIMMNIVLEPDMLRYHRTERKNKPRDKQTHNTNVAHTALVFIENSSYWKIMCQVATGFDLGSILGRFGSSKEDQKRAPRRVRRDVMLSKFLS